MEVLQGYNGAFRYCRKGRRCFCSPFCKTDSAGAHMGPARSPEGVPSFAWGCGPLQMKESLCFCVRTVLWTQAQRQISVGALLVCTLIAALWRGGKGSYGCPRHPLAGRCSLSLHPHARGSLSLLKSGSGLWPAQWNMERLLHWCFVFHLNALPPEQHEFAAALGAARSI